MLVRREILHLHILHFLFCTLIKKVQSLLRFSFATIKSSINVSKRVSTSRLIWMHIEYCPLFPILESFSVYRYL